MTHNLINIEINIYLGALFQIVDLPLHPHTLGAGRPSKIYSYLYTAPELKSLPGVEDSLP